MKRFGTQEIVRFTLLATVFTVHAWLDPDNKMLYSCESDQVPQTTVIQMACRKDLHISCTVSLIQDSPSTWSIDLGSNNFAVSTVDCDVWATNVNIIGIA